jgi:hypothetical protein
VTPGVHTAKHLVSIGISLDGVRRALVDEVGLTPTEADAALVEYARRRTELAKAS